MIKINFRQNLLLTLYAAAIMLATFVSTSQKDILKEIKPTRVGVTTVEKISIIETEPLVIEGNFICEEIRDNVFVADEMVITAEIGAAKEKP